MNKIIQVSELTKSYGNVHAVKGINFYVEQGTLFAFLGENGAGKSTTIDIISTLLKPNSGNVLIDGFTLGKEDNQIRSSIGIVFQDSLLDPLLTVKENLEIRGSFYQLKRAALQIAIKQAAEIADINEFINRPYGKLSGGQRRRVDIARALIHTPKILFLDEPTTGLDPQTRKNVWDTIKKLQKETGMTVFLTTHYMEEAAQADYITIMGHGEIVAKGTPLELKERFATDLLKIKPIDEAELSETLNRLHVPFTITNHVFQIQLQRTIDSIEIIENCKSNIANLEVINGTMDDVFIHVTGKGVES
ncbi:ABC transporter ATP-binding protein [Brevibacillus daliensis]|uniref:ABC transporter ATP-binding protein n=1 Tax=Brevibacillus daliensis TaxID=2892995 RepID=UPI001E28EB45|nr:ATP-binding cassette domain-containing protein [Brevibacillus daliensis]